MAESALTEWLESTGLSGLRNALGDDANRILATTDRVDEVIAVLLLGLRVLGVLPGR